jgi:deoxyribonuclease V
MAAAELQIPDMVGCLERLLAQVPAGCVTTPGALAAALGNPVAARWIGHYLLHHPQQDLGPRHRVVRAGGRVLSAGQAARLRAEGIEVRTPDTVASRVSAGGQGETSVDLERYGFQRFAREDPPPLEKLSRLQHDVVRRVRTRPPRGVLRLPRVVGGVDISYTRTGEGVAAYCLVDVASGALDWSATVRRPVRFPYISSYLSFRELPILLDLLDEVRAAGRLAAVLLVDGTGILHPRHAGIASHLGVLASVATIGVTKKLLCGQVQGHSPLRPLESRPVLLEGQPAGIALRPTAGSLRPIYISPGHCVDLAFSERLARRLLVGRRLPEPIYWADRLSRRCAKNAMVSHFVIPSLRPPPGSGET